MVTKEEYYGRKADKKSQEEKKRAERWQSKIKEPVALFTAVLAICTLLLVGVGALQWGTLKKTDQTLRIGQRPWIKVVEIHVVEGTGHEPAPTFELSYLLKNVGHLPAFVKVGARIISSGGPGGDLFALQREKCEETKAEVVKDGWVHKSTGNFPVPFSVLPDDSWPYNLRSALEQSSGPDNQLIKKYSADVIGCVIYQSHAGDKTLHRSSFFGRISYDWINNPGDPDFHEIDRDIPVTSERHLVVKGISMAGEAD